MSAIPETAPTDANERVGLAAAVPYSIWMKDVTPPQWLWQYFVAPGIVSTLVGDSGRGKTTLVSRLLAALITGQNFLGLATGGLKGKILVVSEEPRSAWLERPQLSDRVWFLDTEDLGAWSAFCEELEHAQHDFELVIVDSFDEIFTGTSQSESAEINAALRPFARAVKKRGFAGLILDFLRKRRDTTHATAKDLAGSYAKARIVSVVATLYEADEDEASPKRTLAIKKSRFTTPEDWRRGVIIELQPNGQYARLGTAREIKADAWQQKQMAVLQLLHQRGIAGTPWVTPVEIDQAAGITDRRQRPRLITAINTPDVIIVDNGKRNRFRAYALKQFVV